MLKTYVVVVVVDVVVVGSNIWAAEQDAALSIIQGPPATNAQRDPAGHVSIVEKLITLLASHLTNWSTLMHAANIVGSHVLQVSPFICSTKKIPNMMKSF